MILNLLGSSDFFHLISTQQYQWDLLAPQLEDVLTIELNQGWSHTIPLLFAGSFFHRKTCSIQLSQIYPCPSLGLAVFHCRFPSKLLKGDLGDLQSDEQLSDLPIWSSEILQAFIPTCYTLTSKGFSCLEILASLTTHADVLWRSKKHARFNFYIQLLLDWK